jgi:2,3-bisphosphoglycerate-dependent phosphoglycerate mutase
MTRLVLVRHGQSMAQVEQTIAGHDTCKGLSDVGRRQVEALRDRLAATGEVRADVLLTSVLPRAVETAAILAPAVGAGDAVQDCDLCEIHPGEAEGLTWDEYQERYFTNTFSEDSPPVPGMESVQAFTERVSRTLRRYAEAHAGATIVAAVHGGIIDSSLRTFFGLPAQPPTSYLVNASITEWVHEPHRFSGDPEPRWALVRWNDHAHLTGTDLLVDP